MNALMTILAAGSLLTAPTTDQMLPASLDLETVRSLTVQHDGRWPPLDTCARDTVESVTGQAFFQGHDPVLLLLAWTFDSDRWMHQPLITIANAELRAKLQLPATQSVFSYLDLMRHEPLQTLIDQVSRVEGRKLDPLESEAGDLGSKLVNLQRAFRGEVIRPVPEAENPMGAWRPIAAPTHGQETPDDPVQAAWAGLKRAFLADDAVAFAAASDRLASSLARLPAAYRPSGQLIRTELRYNRLRPFRSAWMAMVVGALLAAGAMLVRRKWFDVLAVLGLLVGFGLLTYGLWLRWQIAGRIPAANMFESLLFLSWGMGAFAILALLFLRHRIVPLTASAMGALALLLADCLPLDHYVRPIVPVLMDTVWMSIHVPVIMVSYSVLALAVLIAHLQLVVTAAAPRKRRLSKLIDALHYWYVHVGAILLLAGIVTGSMWAASSWGRYWGWDPKEVWSLVAFLGYLAILHVRVNHERTPPWAYVLAALGGLGLLVLVAHHLDPITGGKALALAGTAVAMCVFVLTRGHFATALKSILAFWLIIMTYVGVNFVLGKGLHSYGFGTGAVVRYMFLIGGIDLLLVLLCSLVYLARRKAPGAEPDDHELAPAVP